MAQIMFNHVGGKPPYFDGTSFDYWKIKMKMHLGSIHEKVWDVMKNDFVILDPTNPTPREQENKQCNTMALNTIYNAIDPKVFEQIKDLEKASEVWMRLEETYEGTSMVKSAKLYMLKDKLTNFKIKDDESIIEIFKTLHTIIFRGGLKTVTPNEVLGDVMTEDQYNDGSDEEVKEEDKKKKKSVAFKATSSKSKKGKAKREESSDDEEMSDIDDEVLALFVRKFGKFMKKVYGARKRRDRLKNKDYVRRCYKCKSKDHIIADCPYNSDNDVQEKKKEKKEKEKKLSFTKKKKGGSYVVTWDSDASSDDDDSSDDEKKTSKKKATKVQCDESDSSDGESDDDEEHSKEDLMDMLEQAHTCFEMKRKECKELQRKLKALEQSFDELNATHEGLVEVHEKLCKAHKKLEKAHSSLLEQNKKKGTNGVKANFIGAPIVGPKKAIWVPKSLVTNL
ncbi:uncharacterized protein [Miscanthus floridulus]|uniref:uncharacterized protein n=1 Tax=Miscanthus floridulus TaxID=154761 RepID=UPI003457A222